MPSQESSSLPVLKGSVPAVDASKCEEEKEKKMTPAAKPTQWDQDKEMVQENLKEVALGAFVSLLEKKEFEGMLVRKLNENVDVPFVNEQTEERCLTGL